ncbi:toll/interleukin-1 receptor domain-containing protein [Streptomyces lincolnensis]|uniref:toll/interleukin-1 receptor domain-containing protein n=1 Tax=Streptomyces lincolnensis TaxID=1915 RepID=UPI0013520CA7|nr:toll/interleukin-1 receptor domain-containing protein [Streptomyces lincolnensis]
MAQIFINYRKEGGAYAAALLDEMLASRFGEERVFRAARSITPGSDYSRSILEAVAECEVLLAIVDRGWLARFNPEVSDSPSGQDWVLREIEEAFKNERTVIPVLLSGVERLDEGSLPEVLMRVARLQYVRLDYRNIRQDVNYIAEQLIKVCPSLGALRCQGPSNP